MMPTKFANGGPVRFLDIENDAVVRAKDIFDFQKAWSKDRKLDEKYKKLLASIKATNSPMIRMDISRGAGKKAYERWERENRISQHYRQMAIDTNKPIIINSVV